MNGWLAGWWCVIRQEARVGSRDLGLLFFLSASFRRGSLFDRTSLGRLPLKNAINYNGLSVSIDKTDNESLTVVASPPQRPQIGCEQRQKEQAILYSRYLEDEPA